MSLIRVGNGFDVHPFCAGRRLVLGGVEIPSEQGLAGHSDADVLLHAITDAVLGALSWGDIGQWFPSSDEKWKGADSSQLFLQVWRKAQDQGWELGNCDCVILAEKPRLFPHMAEIQSSLARLFGSELNQVSVKATTTEKLGFVGREEGIAASSVLLLVRSSLAAGL